jgi:hypothetical protein
LVSLPCFAVQRRHWPSRHLQPLLPFNPPHQGSVKPSMHFPSINSVCYSSIKPFPPIECFETAGHRHGH